MNNCVYAFKSGKKKDQLCGKSAEGYFCDKHKQHLTSLMSHSIGAPGVLPQHKSIATASTAQLPAETLDQLYLKLLSIQLTPENRNVIEKKIKYTSTLNNNSTEYHKNISWLKHALAFPYEKCIHVPVACNEASIAIEKNTRVSDIINTSSDPAVTEYISKVFDALDSYIYGMDKVKEEIMSFVCKRISNPNSTDHVLALQGANGVGKCFAFGTPILMYDGSVVPVQKVLPGDKLMGDDHLPRTVLTLGNGYDDMYTVRHLSTGQYYTVNSEHILVLKNLADNSVTELTVKDYLKLDTIKKTRLKGYSLRIAWEDIITSRSTFQLNPYLLAKKWLAGDTTVINHKLSKSSNTTRITFLRCILSLTSNSCIPRKNCTGCKKTTLTIQNKALAERVANLCWSTGVWCRFEFIPHGDFYKLTIDTYPKSFHDLTSDISVERVGSDWYYGFTIDGNERFLLGNNVVTHNTRLARGLSQALGIPFRTINLGSVNDVSYFTGHGFTYVESEPGRIVQIMEETGVRNPICYLDELDKIHQTEKGQAINGFLTHLIDPSQNKAFQDVYLNGLELDVSQVFFVFSFNDESLLDKTVRDRLNIIHIEDPSLEDKINILEKFIVPEVCANLNLHVKLTRDILHKICMSESENKGLRGVKRLVEDIISKINVIRMLEKQKHSKLSYYKESYYEMVEHIINENGKTTESESVMQMYS